MNIKFYIGYMFLKICRPKIFRGIKFDFTIELWGPAYYRIKKKVRAIKKRRLRERVEGQRIMNSE